MNNRIEMILQICPELIKRAPGGWLAVSPDRAVIRIGVTGSTENEARDKFTQALQKWADIPTKE